MTPELINPMDPLTLILAITRPQISTRVAGVRRMDRVREALGWQAGTLESPVYHPIWSGGMYQVSLAKPGKESPATYNLCRYKDGRRGNNPNDMRPSIHKDGVLIDTHVASFTDIFDELQTLAGADEYALELIACLLFRSAYMVDHEEVQPGQWRYRVPEEALAAIVARQPTADGLPMEVFLHFLDALAWNEDVKYHTLGFDVRLGYGRRNNLLTCVNLIGVLLNRVSISKFAGSFSRPPAGISAISNRDALAIFPMLTGTP